MSRLWSNGWEGNDPTYNGASILGSLADETTIVHGGLHSVKINNGNPGADTEGYWNAGATLVTGRKYFFRVYIYLSNYPTGDCEIMNIATGAVTDAWQVRLRSDGTCILWNNVSAAQVGSASGVVSQGAWHR